MIARRLAALMAVGSLGGCAAVSSTPQPPAPDQACNAASAQIMVGRRADASLGAELLRLTGARMLRWVPPRTAVTMDFRADRLTVSYDDNMAVDRISCG